jgi:outer membrane lipoprotein-sorting protein
MSSAALGLLICVLLWQLPSNLGQLLFAKFEQKLTKAKNFKVEYEIRETKDGKDAISTNGSIIVTSSNQAKVIASEKRANGITSKTFVLDGKRMHCISEVRENSTVYNGAALKNQAFLITIHLARMGMFSNLSGPDGGWTPKPRDSANIVLSGFRFLSDQSIDKNQPFQVEFELMPPKPDAVKPMVKRQLWFDRSTGLLLKRVYETRIGANVYGLVETYTNWQFDVMLDDKEFVLKAVPGGE